MRVVIDGVAIRSESDIHEILSRALDFGPYYGNNLNALWDRLSVDVERPVEVVWKNSNESRISMGLEAFEAVKMVLIKAMRQDERFGLDEKFTVVFE